MRERLGHIFCILGVLCLTLSLVTFSSDHTGSLLFILTSSACSIVGLVMLSDAAVVEEEEDQDVR